MPAFVHGYSNLQSGRTQKRNHYVLIHLRFFTYPSNTASSCREGWKAFGSHCYYFADTAKVSFSQAETECENMDADLASIHNSDEQNFVAGKLLLSMVGS